MSKFTDSVSIYLLNCNQRGLKGLLFRVFLSLSVKPGAWVHVLANRPDKSPVNKPNSFAEGVGLQLFSRYLSLAVFSTVILLVSTGQLAQAQVSGTVFRDYNANGIRDMAEEGVASLTVTAYFNSTAVSTVISATNGAYSFPATGTNSVPSGTKARLEFSGLPTGNFSGAFSAAAVGNGTSVQFVTAGAAATNINFGINLPVDYCQTNPPFIVPCYVNGDPLKNGTAGTGDVIVSVPYTSTGDSPTVDHFAINSQVGTVFGLAYQRDSKFLFSAAFMKRHSGFGPGGTGGIYKTTTAGTPVSSVFVNLDALGFDTGTDPRTLTPTGVNTVLPAAKADPNRDINAFDAVGKVGLGDLEISDDGTQLYTINLFDRKLYRINISDPANTTPTAADVSSYSIAGSTPACPTGSVFRPFAVKYYHGLVYVGGVCTNEAVSTTITIVGTGANSNAGTLVTRDTTGMKAFVFEFNPTTTLFSQVLSFPLTYRKGASANDQTGADRADRWLPWISAQPARFARNSVPAVCYPQPWLTGIEFDVDGSMILSLRDRFGDQYGNANYGTNTASTQTYNAIAPGDILRAGKCNTAVNQWTIENNAQICPGVVTTGANNGQGLGNGEFYYSDAVSVGDNGGPGGTFRPYHLEMAQGGLALLRGSGEVASIVMDPTDAINSGGIRRFNNITGASSNTATSVQIFVNNDVSLFGKANGLGDLEIACNLAPVEIGNRVWKDDNRNGIQDPTEAGISGVTITLYKSTTLIATAVTNADGEYYFSSGPGTNTTSAIYNLTALTIGSNVELRINQGQAALVATPVTLANQGSNDAIDSDFTVSTVGSTTNVITAVTLGAHGENNHQFDAGFAPPCSILATVTPTVCNTATNQYSISGTASFTNALASTLTITDGTSTTTISVTAGQTSAAYSLTGLSSGTGSHTVTATLSSCGTTSTTYTAPLSCTVGVALSVTPGLCSTATNGYSVTGSLSLTNAVVGTATITDGTATTTVSVSAGATSVAYSLTGLSSGTGLHTVTVSYATKTTSQTYTAPLSCTVGIALSVTPGACLSATNQYSISGTLSLINAIAGTATITDGTSTTAVTVTAGATSVAYSLTGLTSGTGSHTVTVSYATKTASQTYTAPLSCTVGVALSVTPGLCSTATNGYSVTGSLSLTNAVVGTATITDGTATTTVSVSAGATSVAYSLTGLSSGTGLHTVTVSYATKTANQTYTAPLSCTVGIALSVTPGVCQSATNGYSITGTLSLTNAIAGTATITDGTSTTAVTVTAGATSVPYTLAGLNSGTGLHTVAVSYASKTASLTYTAPLSCTVAPPCLLSVVVTPGVCNTATNQYSVTGSVSVVNATGNQVVTLTDGTTSTTVTLTGSGPTSFTLSGLTSNAALHTVSASAATCGVASNTYTAPASCEIILALAVLDPGTCQPTNNDYAVTGIISLTNAIAGTATVTDGTTTLLVPITAGQTTANYSLTGLTSGTGSHTVTTTYEGIIVSTTYSSPTSCTQPTGTVLSLSKLVDKSKAQRGDVLTYTVILTNTGSTSATNVVVRDSSTTGLTYVIGSATAPAGTTFTQGTPLSYWTVGSISAGQSFSLTFQALADSSGILYNKATIPGDTATVCTSVPVKVCTGDTYTFQLTAAPGRSSYKWFKDNVEIVGQTTNVLNVTAPGTYSLAVDNVSGSCPDFSCCPFIVEEDTLPGFQATAIPVTCIGNTAQVNGKIVLSQFRAGYTYQYSAGATFNEAASLSGLAQVIPVGGVITSTLSNPVVAGTYTIRVYNVSGCYTDVTVVLVPTICGCPADVCIPFVISQTKRAQRIGDPR